MSRDFSSRTEVGATIKTIPTTRTEAKALQSSTFFNGHPCRRGHIAFRWASSGVCTKCDYSKQANSARRRRLHNPEKREQQRVSARIRYTNNIETMRAKDAKRRESEVFRKQKAEAARVWRLKNLEKSRANTAAWQKLNKAAVNAYSMERNAAELRAVPPWVDAKHREKIMQLYETAQQLSGATGVNYEVDHVVPLRSKVVCGLHVWWNLQVITELENRNKLNKFDACVFPAQGTLAFEILYGGTDEVKGAVS